MTNEIHVTAVGPGEAEYGVAEFWAGDRMIGFTAEALAEANRLLAPVLTNEQPHESHHQ